MPIEFELIHKMRRKLNAESSILAGLSGQIVEASRLLSQLSIQAADAAARAARFPEMEPMSPAQKNDYFNAMAEARRRERDRIVTEANMAGVDPAPLLAEIEARRNEIDLAAEYAGAAEAEAVRARAEHPPRTRVGPTHRAKCFVSSSTTRIPRSALEKPRFKVEANVWRFHPKRR